MRFMINYSVNIILFLLIFSIQLKAHIHWIIPADSSCKSFKICSGHQFPQSDFAVAKRLIHKVYIYSGKQKREIKRIEQYKDHLSFKSLIKNDNPSIVEVQFKKPVVNEPFYINRYIFLKKKYRKEDYSLGNDLEIVLLDDIKAGEKIPFQITYKNKPVKGIITVHTKSKKSYWRTDKNGVVQIKMEKKGWIMLYAKYRRRACSLVLFIR